MKRNNKTLFLWEMRAYREHRWISNSVVAFTLFKHDTFGSLITVVISTMLVPKAASA